MKTLDKLQNKVLYTTLFIVIMLAANKVIGQTGNIISGKKEQPTIHVMFSAGQDALICNEDDFITEGFNNTPVMTIWQSSGDGIFEDSNNPVTTYSPGEQDVISGSVTLTLFLVPMGGNGAGPVLDSMILYLGNCKTSNQF